VKVMEPEKPGPKKVNDVPPIISQTGEKCKGKPEFEKEREWREVAEEKMNELYTVDSLLDDLERSGGDVPHRAASRVSRICVQVTGKEDPNEALAFLRGMRRPGRVEIFKNACATCRFGISSEEWDLVTLRLHFVRRCYKNAPISVLTHWPAVQDTDLCGDYKACGK
jgi:hypothetical protein